MELSVYEKMYEVEKDHFYYQALRKFISQTIKNYKRTSQISQLKILDVGCGTGLTTQTLKKYGDVVGVDINLQALKFSKTRGLKVRRASVEGLPFKNSNFDVVVCIDVIYHQEVHNDSKALGEIFRVLKPQGICILRVPAHRWLYQSYDRLVHTRKRYSKAELVRKCQKSGFKIKSLSYIDSFLMLPTLLMKIKESLRKPKQNTMHIEKPTHIINKVLTLIALSEVTLILKVPIPFGIGLIAVLSKPYRA